MLLAIKEYSGASLEIKWHKIFRKKLEKVSSCFICFYPRELHSIENSLDSVSVGTAKSMVDLQHYPRSLEYFAIIEPSWC